MTFGEDRKGDQGGSPKMAQIRNGVKRGQKITKGGPRAVLGKKGGPGEEALNVRSSGSNIDVRSRSADFNV